MKRENIIKVTHITNRLDQIAETRVIITNSINSTLSDKIMITIKGRNSQDCIREKAFQLDTHINAMLYANIESELGAEEEKLIKELDAL